jgi:hypothetical protein
MEEMALTGAEEGGRRVNDLCPNLDKDQSIIKTMACIFELT